MELINFYKCLGDVQRLRIINLLNEGPLCVCHLQEILGEAQVKISKQLLYMKKLGVVFARREGVWMVYSLSVPAHPVLLANVGYLRANNADEFACFAEDLHIRSAVLQRYADNLAECPQVVYQAANGC
ncbi:winged helix-turn-helix transcriptional regulator [Methylovulum psychrotolerans]|uniref:ArsR/SmtB family transcription factor n=1 Tax=Methylovulum psychrotolerans TaxID=1704499 RepID=UPI001BFFCCF7|nr:winged helix-turn-helix transcriptional regulator [Methylovulum psychrotolerans]